MSHLDEGQLHELLDGELDAPARAAALAHLAGCERCKAAYDEAAAFLAESDALIEMVQVPATVVNREAAVVNREARGASQEAGVDQRRTRRLGSYRTLAWAASLVLAVGIGWYGSGLNRQAAPSASEVVLSTLPDTQPPAAPPSPNPASGPERRAKPAETLADKELARSVTSTPTAEKARPVDAVGAAAGNAQPAPLAEEPRPEVSGMMAQKAAPAAAPAAPTMVTPPGARDERQREADDLAARARVPLAGADRATYARQALTPTTFRVIGMEEAVRILGGSIRLIDGLTPTRVLAGRSVGGKDAATVRVVYEDPPGRELWLDQRREASSEAGRADATTALLPGDTLMVVREQGVRSLDWIDQTGFLLRLTGYVPADSLQRLQARVR